jgi:hypothetical protein
MIESKKTLTTFLIMAILFSGCSSEITISKLNKPAYKNFKKTIKQDKIEAKQYIEGDPDIVKKIVGEDKYFFERQIKIRNRIIDSLSLLKKDKFMIIDSRGDNNGQRIELSYFFYDDKISFVWFNRKDSISNGEVFAKFTPKIENRTREHLQKTNPDVIRIYYSIEGNNPPDFLDGGSERTSYRVTKVSNGEIFYYSVSGAGNYKITKLD